ncbi:MAG: PEP-CTERM sorting domain-containing protein, partial [Phycisphaerae bacterium]|nr:PEP-CTERM sorting domain-containing protein [Phycisphaerae bacterium]
GYIGIEHGTGEVTVDGNGSTWTNSGDLIVGCEGQGTLNITNGGVVSNTTGYIDSIGEVTVDGNGSTWANTYGLFVGLHGQGTLNITNGGAVSNSYGYISSWSDSIGEVTVDGSGSTWANSGNLSVGHYEGQGTLNITDGGTVTVGGNLSINSQSTLNILLASPGDPLLNVAGDATLNGMLNVDLASGFALNQGDLFILIDLTDISNTITGTFTGLAEGDSVGNFDGLDLLISYAGGDGNDVTLSAIPEPATLSLLVMGGLALIRRRQK